MEKIAVIAGTPIDTQMGAEFLQKKGLETEEFPVSENPVEQTKFQAMPQETKELEMKKIINKIKECGIKKNICILQLSKLGSRYGKTIKRRKHRNSNSNGCVQKNSCGLQLSRCICS